MAGAHPENTIEGTKSLIFSICGGWGLAQDLESAQSQLSEYDFS